MGAHRANVNYSDIRDALKNKTVIDVPQRHTFGIESDTERV